MCCCFLSAEVESGRNVSRSASEGTERAAAEERRKNHVTEGKGFGNLKLRPLCFSKSKFRSCFRLWGVVR